jgi:hypothetical protein
MEARLIAYVVGVALSIAASFAAIASQSDKFVGVHEVPPFVCDRVELVADLTVGRSGGGVGAGGRERVRPDGVRVPGSCNAICAHGAGV